MHTIRIDPFHRLFYIPLNFPRIRESPTISNNSSKSNPDKSNKLLLESTLSFEERLIRSYFVDGYHHPGHTLARRGSSACYPVACKQIGSNDVAICQKTRGTILCLCVTRARDEIGVRSAATSQVHTRIRTPG